MNKFEFKNLTPFKWFVLENFPFIEEDFDAITNWQLFCKLGKEINKIIDSQNIVGTQMENVTNAFIEFTKSITNDFEVFTNKITTDFNELEEYVNNYFNNLDVQEEINNKLDDMAEQGTLQKIIGSYLTIKSLLAFSNINSMKQSTNLVEGSSAKTLGYNEINDGGSALYNVRLKNNNDVPDDKFIIQLNNENLVAELIIENNTLNIKQIGAKGDNETDNTDILQYAINKRIPLYIPNGIYIINNPIKLLQYTSIIGQSKTETIIKCINNFNDRSTNEDINNITLKNLGFEGTNNNNGLNLSGSTVRPFTGGRYSNLENLYFKNFNIALQLQGVWATKIINCRFISNNISCKQLGTCNNINYTNCVFNGNEDNNNDIGINIISDGGSENYNINIYNCDFELLNRGISCYAVVSLNILNSYVERVNRFLYATNLVAGYIKGGNFNGIDYLASILTSGSTFLINSILKVSDIFVRVTKNDNTPIITENENAKCLYNNINVVNNGTGFTFITTRDSNISEYNINSNFINNIESSVFNARYSSSIGKLNNMIKKDIEKIKLISPKLIFTEDCTLGKNISVYIKNNNNNVFLFNIPSGTHNQGDEVIGSYIDITKILISNFDDISISASTVADVNCNLKLKTGIAIGEMSNI